MIAVILKALLILIQVLAAIALIAVVVIYIGVRYDGWEINIAYKKEE